MVGIGRAATLLISNAVGILSFAFLLFAITDATMAQVLRDPPTPYHFLRYDDTPDDQKNPAWPKDIWQPIKFIALDLAPGSYINFGGEIRERFEYFSAPFFGLTPRGHTYALSSAEIVRKVRSGKELGHDTAHPGRSLA